MNYVLAFMMGVSLGTHLLGWMIRQNWTIYQLKENPDE